MGICCSNGKKGTSNHTPYDSVVVQQNDPTGFLSKKHDHRITSSKYANRPELKQRKLTVMTEENSYTGDSDVLVLKHWTAREEKEKPQSHLRSTRSTARLSASNPASSTRSLGIDAENSWEVARNIDMTIMGGFDPSGNELKYDCQDDADFAVLPNGDLLAAVFDGHGAEGRACSHFCTKHMKETLLQQPNYRFDISGALVQTLVDLDSELNRSLNVNTLLSGTTATLCLIRGRICYIASLGDSRAMIISSEKPDASGKWKVFAMTRDHKPNILEEKERIENAGGRVDSIRDQQGIGYGPARVWLKHDEMPGLAMSRSIGDLMAHGVGVSSVPDVYATLLTEKDQFIILSSDGLTEFIPDEEITEKIAGTFRSQRATMKSKGANLEKANSSKNQGALPNGWTKDSSGNFEDDSFEWSAELARYARSTWLAKETVVDDISCVAFRLDTEALANYTSDETIEEDVRLQNPDANGPPTGELVEMEAIAISPLVGQGEPLQNPNVPPPSPPDHPPPSLSRQTSEKKTSFNVTARPVSMTLPSPQQLTEMFSGSRPISEPPVQNGPQTNTNPPSEHAESAPPGIHDNATVSSHLEEDEDEVEDEDEREKEGEGGGGGEEEVEQAYVENEDVVPPPPETERPVSAISSTAAVSLKNEVEPPRLTPEEQDDMEADERFPGETRSERSITPDL